MFTGAVEIWIESVEDMLKRHLETCRDDTRETRRQIDEFRKDIEEKLEEQTDEIWKLLWRTALGVIATLGFVIWGLLEWMHK